EPVFIYEGQVLAGKYYFKTGDFKKAVEWLSRALPIAKQFSKEDYAEAIKYMGLSLQAEGKDGDAIKYFSEYSSILDSITAKKISTNLADQATRYETGRKEIRIKFLDNENRVRNLELQKASRTRLILIISLCGLGIISLLLYSIYSNREKMNIQLNDRNVQLDKVNNELSVANETKATLFGIIAHDLRAPVSKIVQMIHLQKANPTINGINATEDFSERINEASENVLETMEDLLLWSKSQMKNFKPQFRMVNINHLISQEINLFKEEINDKKLLININTDQQISYRSDENFLAVIIRNLLQNAIKNSSEGKVINIEILKDQIVISNNCNKEEVNKLNLLLEQKNISSQYSGFGLQMAKGLANQIGLKIYFKENGNDIISVVVEGLENLEES
ncbi:MAG: HAMP domain-containing sensor histidine kinase, partial [Ginsengibacter sp.]